MRILVLLNATGQWGTRTEYTKLRQHLLSDGFLEIAPESYVRVVPSRKENETHIRRIKVHAPTTGTVRAFSFTEKQWNRSVFIAGGTDYQEDVVGPKRHISL